MSLFPSGPLRRIGKVFRESCCRATHCSLVLLSFATRGRFAGSFLLTAPSDWPPFSAAAYMLVLQISPSMPPRELMLLFFGLCGTEWLLACGNRRASPMPRLTRLCTFLLVKLVRGLRNTNVPSNNRNLSQGGLCSSGYWWPVVRTEITHTLTRYVYAISGPE